MNFESKKVLITGGSKGIGHALIAALYEHEVRQFAVVGRNLEKMQPLKEEFPEAEFLLLQGDVSKIDAIKSFVKQVEDSWGALDILINNAGVVSAGKLEEISDDDIIAQQNINVSGLILLTKHALPLLKASDDAAIINISSGLGLIGMPYYAPYAATKAAVKQFSEAIRREFDSYDIHVMTVYPTGTDTPMMETTARENLDSPELVATRTLEGLRNGAIDVILGGKQRIADNRENFENPLQFDKKVRSNRETMKKNASGHRAM